MATTTMIDAIHDSVHNIPVSSPKVAGYVSGTADIIWTAADWARFPRAGKVRIEQGYPHFKATGCDVFDVETAAVTPAQAAQGVRLRIAAGITWTTVYGSDSSLAAVLAALKALGPTWYYGHVDCWLANWALSQAEAAAIIGTIVHGMTCRAVQWASPQSNPNTRVPGSRLTLAQANVDLSVTQPSWHAYVPAAAASQVGEPAAPGGAQPAG